MQVELMLNWCVLNQSFVKSLSAQILEQFFQVYGLDPYEGLCSFYIHVKTLFCPKVCAISFYDYGFALQQ